MNFALLCGVSSALAALLGSGLMGRRRQRNAVAAGTTASLAGSTQVSLLFHGTELIDATQSALDYLDAQNIRRGDSDAIYLNLLRRFPDFREAMNDTALVSRTLVSSDGLETLCIEPNGAGRRLVLGDTERAKVTLDRDAHASLRRELETLRATTTHVPFLVWRQSADGKVSWVNQAYLDLVETSGVGESGIWPPPALFVMDLDRVTSDETRRIKLTTPNGQEDTWYECHIAKVGADFLITATEANSIVSAETALRDFVQTLSKTFAHLSTGLAVFDKNNRLALFNPALTDLTALPIDMLLKRPTLSSFLDALRASNMMPEPKNYTSWRDRIADLERSAQDGTYSELWHLPTSQTYRVTGRPQPDGAVALLIEDISAEISLTRKFRTELETGQAVLDSLESAIAVFNPVGVLVMSNKAYDMLWHSETQDSFEQLTMEDAITTWMASTAPTPIWGDVRSFAGNDFERAEWGGSARMKDGRGVDCTFKPLTGGATLVRFDLRHSGRKRLKIPAAAQEAVQQRLGA